MRAFSLPVCLSCTWMIRKNHPNKKVGYVSLPEPFLSKWFNKLWLRECVKTEKILDDKKEKLNKTVINLHDQLLTQLSCEKPLPLCFEGVQITTKTIEKSFSKHQLIPNELHKTCHYDSQLRIRDTMTPKSRRNAN